MAIITIIIIIIIIVIMMAIIIIITCARWGRESGRWLAPWTARSTADAGQQGPLQRTARPTAGRAGPPPGRWPCSACACCPRWGPARTHGAQEFSSPLAKGGGEPEAEGKMRRARRRRREEEEGGGERGGRGEGEEEEEEENEEEE